MVDEVSSVPQDAEPRLNIKGVSEVLGGINKLSSPAVLAKLEADGEAVLVDVQKAVSAFQSVASQLAPLVSAIQAAADDAAKASADLESLLGLKL